jgi:hypothetical protein
MLGSLSFKLLYGELSEKKQALFRPSDDVSTRKQVLHKLLCWNMSDWEQSN